MRGSLVDHERVHTSDHSGKRPQLSSLARRLGAVLVSAALVIGSASTIMAPQARADDAPYTIYPTPHVLASDTGSVALPAEKIRTVVESGIDEATVARVDEALGVKSLTRENTAEIPTNGDTSLLLGINGSGGAVDNYVKTLPSHGLTYESDLFSKTDSYLLTIRPPSEGSPSQIIILGSDADSVFYGATTLFQILQQVDTDSLSALTISDWADVTTRGFIEGYYGEPWSVNDRINLMTWGGYYKLNAYVYAPKDDPKHNAKWRELYTDEELTSKIVPQAQAGNASKVRFLYALHPFMNDSMRFDANYDADLALLKSKYLQVIDSGVRQIALLADDAASVGSDNYKKILNDLATWIHELQGLKNSDGTDKYPGLKDKIPFCPPNYYGYGEAWYKDLPSNIQVINTGGRVWGKVSGSFLTTFNNVSGVVPFMWVNWPCSDNDKDALHMGNYHAFLGTDVKPGQVQGVVLNPMQQSEPSKVAIFLNADFTWNLWTDSTHADQAWHDSFTYVDHNSVHETNGSTALRELSSNMLRMYGGGVTWEAGESAAYRSDLLAFQNSVRSRQVNKADIDQIRAIYQKLQNAAKSYRQEAGNKDTLAQISPWIGAWDDLTRAALLYLDALEAESSCDKDAILEKYAAAQAAYRDYRENHQFSYIDHQEKARVGKAFLDPLVTAMDTELAQDVGVINDPTMSIRRFVTSRTDIPEGDLTTVFDGDRSTGVTYKTPNSITTGTFVGVVDTQSFDLNHITFVLGGGKNFFDHAKLQVLRDKEWADVSDASELSGTIVDVTGLSETGVHGVRLIATADNTRDAWLEVKEIEINKPEPDASVSLSASLSVWSGDSSVLLDGHRHGVPLWLKSGGNSQNIQNGDAITVTFNQPKTITSVLFSQGFRSSDTPGTDRISQGILEYSADGTTWTKLADVNGDADQDFTFEPVSAAAIRLTNLADTNYWWQINELAVIEVEEDAAADTVEAEPVAERPLDLTANTCEFTDQPAETPAPSTSTTQPGEPSVTPEPLPSASESEQPVIPQPTESVDPVDDSTDPPSSVPSDAESSADASVTPAPVPQPSETASQPTSHPSESAATKPPTPLPSDRPDESSEPLPAVVTSAPSSVTSTPPTPPSSVTRVKKLPVTGVGQISVLSVMFAAIGTGVIAARRRHR